MESGIEANPFDVADDWELDINLHEAVKPPKEGADDDWNLDGTTGDVQSLPTTAPATEHDPHEELQLSGSTSVSGGGQESNSTEHAANSSRVMPAVAAQPGAHNQQPQLDANSKVFGEMAVEASITAPKQAREMPDLAGTLTHSQTSGTKSQPEAIRKQDEPEQAQHVTAAPSSGWGWGNGWGSMLKAVTAGVVKDVKDLTESFQQALAEVEDGSATDDEEREKPASNKDLKAADKSAPVKHRDIRKATTEKPPADASTAGAGQTATIVAAPPAQQEVDRTPGDESSDLTDEAELETDLTAGAATAFSHLWGGFTRTTASFVSKVEAATKDMAKDLVGGSGGVNQDVAQLQAAAAKRMKGMAANVARLGTRIEASLENVGRTALGLFEDVAGQHGVVRIGQKSKGKSHTTNQQDDGSSASFEHLFDLYGGATLCEELEALANDCARIANRGRVRLELGQQADLDAVLAVLGPIFSQNLEPGRPVSTLSVDEDTQKACEELEQRYVPVQFMCNDSITRAHAYEALLVASAQDALKDSKASSAEQDKTTDRTQQAEEHAGNASTATEGLEADLEGWETDMPTADHEGESAGNGKQGLSAVRVTLMQLQAHACKRLAELSAAQLQLLIDYGTDISSPARSGDVIQSHHISWPAPAAQQAKVLRQQAQRMTGDLISVGAAYNKALQALQVELAKVADHLSNRNIQAEPSAEPQTTQTQVATQQSNPASEPDASPQYAITTSTVEPSAETTTQQQQEQESDVTAGDEGMVVENEDRSLLPGLVSAQCARVASQVTAAQQAAATSIQEAFRGLLYPVLVRALVTQVAGPSSSAA